MKKKVSFISILLTIILTFSYSIISLANENNILEKSTQTTWSASQVQVLAVSPNYMNDNTIFAGTTSGVFISANNGASWSDISGNLPDGEVWSLAVSPDYKNDNTIFAGTYYNGIYRTTDGGNNWTKMNNGIIDDYFSYHIYQIGLQPNFSNSSLSTNKTMFIATATGVYKSTDGGGNWTYLSGLKDGDASIQVLSLSLSPNFANDSTVFAGTYKGMFKTTDGGTTWSLLANYQEEVGFIRVSPNYSSDKTLFMISYESLYKSIDGGSTWNMILGGETFTDVIISPNYGNDNTVFAISGPGVHRSIDGGQNFTEVGGSSVDSFPSPRVVAISPNYSVDKTVICSSDWGVYLSSNSGIIWTKIGIPGIDITPEKLNFVQESPESNPSSKYIELNSTGNGDLNWTAKSSAEWLSVTPLSGANDETLKVSVDTDGLNPGIYFGTIKIVCASIAKKVFKIPVTLTIKYGDFGLVEMGAKATKTINISNNSLDNVKIKKSFLENKVSSEYSASSGFTGVSLAPGTAKLVSLFYKPQSADSNNIVPDIEGSGPNIIEYRYSAGGGLSKIIAHFKTFSNSGGSGNISYTVNVIGKKPYSSDVTYITKKTINVYGGKDYQLNLSLPAKSQTNGSLTCYVNFSTGLALPFKINGVYPTSGPISNFIVEPEAFYHVSTENNSEILTSSFSLIGGGKKADKPKVSFKSTAKPAGSYIKGNLNIPVNASDSGSGIKKVVFFDRYYNKFGDFVSSTKLKEDFYSPYNCIVDTTKIKNGKHVFVAKAYDKAGHSSYVARRYYIDN